MQDANLWHQVKSIDTTYGALKVSAHNSHVILQTTSIRFLTKPLDEGNR